MSRIGNNCVISDDVELGDNVIVNNLCNLYGCKIGDGTTIGSLTEIQRGVSIGKNCKIQDQCSICTGVTIEDKVFIGPGVIFTNDKNPTCTDESGNRLNFSKVEKTIVRSGAVIGAGSIIGPGIEIGEGSFVGMGSVVLSSVGPGWKVFGNPATPVWWRI